MQPSFQNIPNDLLLPGFFIEFQGVPTDAVVTDVEPVIMFAPMTSAGTVDADVPVRVGTAQEAKGLLGQGSFGARMVELFRKNNPQKELWVLPISDAGGSTKALWTITVDAVAVEGRTLWLYVGGQQVAVSIPTDVTVDNAIAAIVARITALPDLPIENVSGATAISGTFTANVDNTLTAGAAHTLAVGDRVRFTTTDTLPAGLALATDYYVISSATPAFTVSAALGGAVVDITDTGTGTHTFTLMDRKTFTVRAKNAGTLGNDIDFRLNHKGSAAGEKTPSGLTVTFAATTPGATDPSLSAAITAMGDEPYDYIVCPWASTELDSLKTLTDDRWAWNKQIYGHVFSIKRDTSANLLTFGGTRNNKHESVVGIYDWPSPVWEVLAAEVGQLSLLLDADPALPEQGLRLEGVLPPRVGSTGRFVDTVRQSLLSTGIASVVASRQVAVIERAITTYQTDDLDATDRTYLDVQTLFTLMRVARYLRRYIQTKFSRKKLAADGNRLAASANVVTPSVVKNELIAAYGNLVQVGWVEDIDYFKDNVYVGIPDDNPNRLDILFPDDLVNQLRTVATLLRFKT